MDDMRGAPRMRTLLSGKIVLASGGRIDCVLRDRSATGARLKVASVIGIPDQFTLILEPAGQPHSVRVAWRRKGEIGDAFGDEPKT